MQGIRLKLGAKALAIKIKDPIEIGTEYETEKLKIQIRVFRFFEVGFDISNYGILYEYS